jgi:hypothetical protein
LHCPIIPSFHYSNIPLLQKIISGGQTGPDRVALDFAMQRGLAHGGWCPSGRLAEDGILDRRYQLRETPDADPAQRTEWNARDSDATVIFSILSELRGGSRLTADLAARHHKPCLHLNRHQHGLFAGKLLTEFLQRHRVSILNVAGPRRSEEPEAGDFALETLQKLRFDDSAS